MSATTKLREAFHTALPRTRDRELARFVLALVLPRALGPVRLYLAAPFIVRAGAPPATPPPAHRRTARG